uniref:Uncharacterized protein n=1 Tax=Rhizophora mucronata TaxID=61149 RepID=A0A2P2QZC4_RHIMU
MVWDRLSYTIPIDGSWIMLQGVFMHLGRGSNCYRWNVLSDLAIEYCCLPFKVKDCFFSGLLNSTSLFGYPFLLARPCEWK